MGQFADVMKDAAEKTNADLASEISSLTRLKDSDIERLFPTKSDKDHLLQLLDIVNAATEENRKIAQLKKNFDSIAGTVIRLVKVLI